MVVDLPLAPLAVLAFAGSLVSLVISLAVIVVSKIAGDGSAAAIARKILIAGAATYALLMLIFSLSSHEYVLQRGAEKHFCEVDCHLAYSVVDVQKTGVPPGVSKTATPSTYYVVTLRTCFDETTINPRRGNGILYPNPREVWVVDEHGKRYSPLLPFGNMGRIQSTPLTQPLRPGESYTTSLLFSLPADVQSPKLFVSNASWPNHLLIGHENSPLHKKAYFAL